MFSQPKNSIVLNAGDPIPPPPGCEIGKDKRPPPMILTYHKDTKGYTPKQVRDMINAKKRYKEECEIVDVQRELARFEARMNPSKKSKYPLPSYPEPPKIDEDLVNAFDEPEATKFYDYPVPQNPLKQKKHCEHTELHMARGCPCCNPEKYSEIRPRTARSQLTSRTLESQLEPPPKKPDGMPYQIGNSFWNVLDETSIPARPKTVRYANTKRPQFSMLRTGPRPGGIPIVLDDLAASRAKGEEDYRRRLSKIDDKEMQEREEVLRKRSETSRMKTSRMDQQMRNISALSGQAWATGKPLSRAASRTEKREIKKEKQKMPKDLEEDLKKVAEFDDKVYYERKKAQQPADELERLIMLAGLNV